MAILTEPMTFEEALAKLRDKRAIASRFNTRDWQRVPVAIRERGFFSATVASAKVLNAFKKLIDDYLTGAREQITMPDGSLTTKLKVGSRADFVELAAEVAKAEGLGDILPPGVGRSRRGVITEIQDIASNRRLNLIFDVQVEQANSYGRYTQGNDPILLDAFPAWKFVRGHEVKIKRPDHEKWENAIRRKDDLDFWLARNDPAFGGFGVPWGPWGFNSGMDVRNVPRRDAVKLGLIGIDEQIRNPQLDFNVRMKADIANMDPKIKQELMREFGAMVTENNKGELVWRQKV